MEHLFLPPKLALKAKKLGFDELCLAYYHPSKHTLHFYNKECSNSDYWLRDTCTAPLYQQIIDWFRKKQIFIDPFTSIDDFGERTFITVYRVQLISKELCRDFHKETLNEAIEEAFKLIR